MGDDFSSNIRKLNALTSYIFSIDARALMRVDEEAWAERVKEAEWLFKIQQEGQKGAVNQAIAAAFGNTK